MAGENHRQDSRVAAFCIADKARQDNSMSVFFQAEVSAVNREGLATKKARGGLGRGHFRPSVTVAPWPLNFPLIKDYSVIFFSPSGAMEGVPRMSCVRCTFRISD